MEGKTTLFVYDHIPSHLAMVNCGGSHFQFCTNSAIYPRFLIWVGFNSHSGNNIRYTLPDELSHRDSVYVDVILRGFPEYIPVCMIKTILLLFYFLFPISWYPIATILSHRYNSCMGLGETKVEGHAFSDTQPNQAAPQSVRGNTVHLATLG
jgi:hypothetical protein